LGTDYIVKLYRDGKFLELESHLQQRRSANPDDPDVAVFSALCAFSIRDYYAAYRYAARLAAHQPRSAEAHALLGRIGDALDHPSLRLSSWQAAVNAAPLNTRYRKRLAACYAEQGRPLLAEAVLDTVNTRDTPITPLWTDDGERRSIPPEAVVVFVPVYKSAMVPRRCLVSLVAYWDLDGTAYDLLVI